MLVKVGCVGERVTNGDTGVIETGYRLAQVCSQVIHLPLAIGFAAFALSQH